MVNGLRLILASAVAGAVLLLSASPVSAQISDTIRPFIYTRVTFDDNVFRAETNPVEDTITRIGGGIDVDVPVSRQRFGGGVRAEQAMYKENDNLDHRNAEARALWNWVVGSRWNGDLSYRYLNTIASFDETAGRTKNNRTDTRAFGSTNFLLTPDWELVGSYTAETTRIENRPQVDNDTSTLSGEVRVALGPRTRVGVRLSQSNADFLYLEDANGLLVSNDYTAYNSSGTFYWQGSGKSSLSARVGFTSVQHEQLTARDVSGEAYRADYLWSLTAATNLNFAVWRDASNREEVAGVVVSNGVEFRPSWRATELLELSLRAFYEKIEFEGNQQYITSTGETRQDDVVRFSADVTYDITRMTSVFASYTRVDRDSNRSGFTYAYNAITLGGRMNF